MGRGVFLGKSSTSLWEKLKFRPGDLCLTVRTSGKKSRAKKMGEDQELLGNVSDTLHYAALLADLWVPAWIA